MNKKGKKMILSIDIETYKWDEEKQEYEPILNTNKYVLGGIA